MIKNFFKNQSINKCSKASPSLNAMESYEEKKTSGLNYGTIKCPCIIKHDKPIGNII